MWMWSFWNWIYIGWFKITGLNFNKQIPNSLPPLVEQTGIQTLKSFDRISLPSCVDETSLYATETGFGDDVQELSTDVEDKDRKHRRITRTIKRRDNYYIPAAVDSDEINKQARKNESRDPKFRIKSKSRTPHQLSPTSRTITRSPNRGTNN
eukprot:UN23822